MADGTHWRWHIDRSDDVGMCTSDIDGSKIGLGEACSDSAIHITAAVNKFETDLAARQAQVQAMLDRVEQMLANPRSWDGDTKAAPRRR